MNQQSAWMEAAAKVEAEVVALRQDNAELEAQNDALKHELGKRENIIDSMRRSQKLDGLRIVDLEEKNRILERDNAVLYSRGDLIVDIIKGDGDRIAASSDLHPDQITNPRKAHDDKPHDMSEAYKRLQDQLENLRPETDRPAHPALSDRPPMMKGVNEDIQQSAQNLEQAEDRKS